MNEPTKRYGELLLELDELAKKQGVVTLRGSATLNARIYAQDQISGGFANGRSQEEIEVEGLEKQIRLLKSQNE